LAPAQRHLFSSLAERAFAGVLEQAAQAGCQILVFGGGLFADPVPSLEDVRAAMEPLSSARRAGMTIIATADHSTEMTDGTSFLAEVGLIDALLSAQGPDSVLVTAADVQIVLATGSADEGFEAADLVLAMDAPGSDTGASAPVPGFADAIINTRSRNAASGALDDIPLIETGWAGPSLTPEVQPGFVILEIDPSTGMTPSLVATDALRPERLLVDSPQVGGDVANLVQAHAGATAILDVDLCGRISRSAWHEVDPVGLSEQTAAGGTLLRLSIDRLSVVDADHGIDPAERASFLVNARRVSDRLAASGDEHERELVAAARSRVVEIARQREPTRIVK
jgi:hypothetical protein